MSFQPAVPFGGLAGWSFLLRTREAQEAAFQQSPAMSRRTADFAERISRLSSAEELVRDRALLEVALGAFGLDDDINNRFFIRKVLEEGTTSSSALANRLSDKRYFALSDTFGFGDVAGGKVRRPGFAADLVARYQERQFEIAVGKTNRNLRLALGLERELAEIAARRQSNDARWFTAMASPPIRTVLERALGLPSQLGSLDIDRQLGLFKERAAARLGTSEFAQIATPEGINTLRRTFLTAPDTAETGANARGRSVLAILSRSPISSAR